MSASQFKHLVRLELLEAVSPEYLIRFLRPYEDYCRARGVLLDGVAVDDAWLRRLCHVLNAVDQEMPVALQQATIDIVELTSEHGREQIVRMANGQQLDLFSASGELSTVDLAFKTYLDNRVLFQASRTRVLVRAVRRFVEYDAAVNLPLEGYLTNATQGLLRSHLVQWFADRNRTGYCDIVVTEEEDEVSFIVIHGQPPRTHGVIEDDESRSRVSYVADKQDLIVFTKSTGRLAVNAQFQIEDDYYRRAMGRVFYGNEDHFVPRPIYSGAPLVEDGRRALSTDGVPGLERVVLREVKVAADDRFHNRVHWMSDDAGSQLDEPFGQELLSMGVVKSFKLDLYSRGRRQPTSVVVSPPRDVEYDRRFCGEMVNDFLKARRFMLVPGSVEQTTAPET